jgi:isochorismate synthase
MTSFALYRLPYEQQVTLVAQTDGTPVELQSLGQLDGQCGFVVAPFAISDACPLVVIRPDVVETYTDSRCQRFQALQAGISSQCLQAMQASSSQAFQSPHVSQRQCYSDDFKRFHEQLLAGRFSKLVLSRCASVPIEDGSTEAVAITAFRRACELYPRLFIALVSTPQTGIWLTATPEVLLERTPLGQWHTMALAGTMRLDDDYPDVKWSEKNIEEQRLVASYIASSLQRFSDDVVETGPRTVRAANLVHLRSDFRFTLYNNARAGELIEALHPTPAVCGLPKDEAFRFILDNEHTPRRYYSGFMGPLFSSQFTVHSSQSSPLSTNPSPLSANLSPLSSLLSPLSTRLFVSLRCMNIASSSCHLYAGGGLLKSSTEEQEWQETEAKMETMRRCIG